MYDPKNDSSPGTSAFRAAHELGGTVVLLQTDPSHCPCGCNQPPSGKNRTFRMGHDARYRGILIRAYVNDAQVVVLRRTDPPVEYTVYDADELANQLDWCQYLETAKRREDRKAQERRERANARLLAKATGPQIGDTRLIRVGRWDYTGQVIAIWETDGIIEFQYVTKQGETKRVQKSREEFADLQEATS